MPQKQINIYDLKYWNWVGKGNEEKGVKPWDCDQLLSYYWTDASGKEKKKLVIQSNILVSMLQIELIIKQTNAFARNKVLIYGKFITRCPIYEKWFPGKTSCKLHNYLGMKKAIFHNLNPPWSMMYFTHINYSICHSELVWVQNTKGKKWGATLIVSALSLLSLYLLLDYNLAIINKLDAG